MDVGLNAELVIEAVDGIELYGTNSCSVPQLDANAMNTTSSLTRNGASLASLGYRWLQSEIEALLAAEESFPVFQMFLCLHLFYLAVPIYIALRSGESQHYDILPISPVFFLRNRQLYIHFLAAHNIRP